MNFWTAIFIFTILGGPAGFLYSVVQLARRRGTPDFGWRDRVSTAGLCLVVISLVLWPVMFFVFRQPWTPEGEELGLKAFESSAAWIALTAIPVSCFGRLKLILPNAAAAAAAMFWWVTTTIP